MKAVKKYSTILIVTLILAGIIFRLMNVKKQRDEELKAIQDYSAVVPVETTVPEISKAKQLLEENGVLRAGAQIPILSEVSGKVTLVKGDVGEHVAAGQILVEVEKDVLESQFNMANASLDNARKDLTRYNNLAGSDAITEQQLESAKLTYENALANYTSLKKQLENTIIRSPVSGVIAARSIEKGAVLMPSMQIFSILEQKKMVFVVKIAENDIGLVSKGRGAQVTFDAVQGKSFSGRVGDIGATSDLSGRYEVEIDIVNPGPALRSGMSGRASFEFALHDTGVVIPRKCIVGSIRDAGVFVVVGDSVVSKKIEAVTLNETDVLVTSGLSVGERIVLSGQMNLRDGSKVKVINRM